VVLAREASDIPDLGQQASGDDRTHAEKPEQGRPGPGDGLAELDLELLDASVEGAHVTDVIHGQLPADSSWLVPGSETGQHGGRLARSELASHPSGRELREEAMKATEGLGPQAHQFCTSVTQEPQGHGVIIELHVQEPDAVESGQPDRHGVVPVSLAAMPLRKHAYPRSQLRWDIHDLLPVRHQTLGQRTAGPSAALNGPRPVAPTPGIAPQFEVAVGRVGEPRSIEWGSSHRIQHRHRRTRLVRVDADQNLVFHLLSSPSLYVWDEEGSATSGEANLS